MSCCNRVAVGDVVCRVPTPIRACFSVSRMNRLVQRNFLIAGLDTETDQTVHHNAIVGDDALEIELLLAQVKRRRRLLDCIPGAPLIVVTGVEQ